MNESLRERVLDWIEGDPDIEDRETLQRLLDSGDEGELHRRFDAPLTFGTAGLRGPVMEIGRASCRERVCSVV